MRELVEAAGRLVANRSVPGSGVTVPSGRIDDTGRVELSSEAMKKTNTSKTPDRKIREMPMKKVSLVLDIQKNNQLKNNFTGVPDTDMRACFNRSTWSPAMNIQQPPLGTSHLILGDILVRVSQNLRTSFTTVMAFGGATVAQIYRTHGGIDEPRKNSGYDELRRGRRSVGFDDGMPIHHAMAETKVRGTDRLHHTDEHEDAIVHWKKAQ